MNTRQHSVSKETALALTREIEQAVKEIFARHGFDAPRPHTTYGESYVCKLSSVPLRIDEQSGMNVATTEARAYLSFAGMYGLDAGLLGKVVRDPRTGEPITFMGIASSRRRYPFAFKKADGRSYFYSDTPSIRALLNEGEAYTAPARPMPAPATPTPAPSQDKGPGEKLGRKELLAELAARGYTGPTSYPVSRLAEILASLA